MTGNQILTPAELNSVMSVAGQPIFLLTPSELETRLLLNYPEISAVQVNVSLPNLVTAHIVERKPFKGYPEAFRAWAGAEWRVHMDRRGRCGVSSARRNGGTHFGGG